MEIVLATFNNHKVGELTELLKSSGWTLRTGNDLFVRPEEPDENGATYEENAEIKARAWAEITGLTALADDSGLEVEALGGRPGLHSSRYAPTVDERIDKLLEELRDVPEGKRGARFVCAVALVRPDGSATIRRGICPGRIGFRRAGEHGFGYDPVFLVDGCDGRTLAELSPEEKNTLSHRARAIEALVRDLKSGSLS